MNARHKLLQVFTATCVLLISSWTNAAWGQEAKKREALLATAKEIITNARFSALITLSPTGEPNVRPIDPLLPDENWVVWFSTNPKSRKVRELRANQRVVLHYFDPKAQAYVALKGTARLVDDSKEKARRWKEEWAPYYPNRDKDLLLVEVTPISFEVVNISKGLLGDPVTWAPDVVLFGKDVR